MNKQRQRAIDSLTKGIVSMYPDDPLATNAKAELRSRDPEAAENILPYEPKQRDLYYGIEPLYDKSPWTPEDLLKTEPADVIRKVIEFNEAGFGVPNRDGLISAVSSAAGQNTEWAFKFLAALLEQNIKDNDLWPRLLWKLKWEDMSVDQRNWLLDSFDASQKYSDEFLAAYTQLVLSHGLPVNEELPDANVLKKQLTLTFLLWTQTSGLPGWKVETPYNENDWIFEAINRPPGHCCIFWLKYTEILQKGVPDSERAWPAEIEIVMNEIVRGETRGQILGLALLGQYLSAVRYMAPKWTKRHLYPCFDFKARGDLAFPPWIGFSGYGRLSRELATELPPYFATAFSRISEFKDSLAERLTGLVAAIAISGHFNVNQDDWLKSFVGAVDEKLDRKWLSHLAKLLKGSLVKDKEDVWNEWLRDYWTNRLEGIPKPINATETECFYKLSLALGPLAHEAVPLVKRLPETSVEWSHIFLDFDKSTLFKEDPDGLVQIVAWWLPQVRSIVAGPKELVAFVEGFPNSPSLLPSLKLIEDEITRLRPEYVPAYAKAVSDKFGT